MSGCLDPIVIVLSGCHGGPNPSPGLGTARSLRVAFPNGVLVGKDHSPQSSGLHEAVFDRVWCCRPWNELDLDDHYSQLHELATRERAYFISGLDLEVRWLAGRPNSWALVPPLTALHASAKPTHEAARYLPVRIPRYIPISAGSREVHRFCVETGWRVWLKGPEYEATRVHSWHDLQESIKRMEEVWGNGGLFLQEDVHGQEVSVAFCAYHGKLLDAVYMEKRLETAEGKTWAGEVSPCPSGFRAKLTQVVRKLLWTGGAELEFVRDHDDCLWLLDWNPRFPAWVHGATLAGRNLPAALVSAATGLDPQPTERVASQFTRVVIEIPVREGFPLPTPSRSSDPPRGGKHPSGMPSLARRLQGPPSTRPSLENYSLILRDTDGGYLDEVLEAWCDAPATPCRVLLPKAAKRALRLARRAISRSNTGSYPRVRLAYSVKTNPDGRFVRLAREFGFLGEVISAEEADWAQKFGYRRDQMIFNGPMAAALPSEGASPYHAVFADSLGALQRILQSNTRVARVVGLRVRAPHSKSRFGIDLWNPTEFKAVVEALACASRDTRFGISFHYQSSLCGLVRWQHMVQAIVYLAVGVAAASGRSFDMLDVGGGWTPDDFTVFLCDRLETIRALIAVELPTVEQLVLEPGKAMSEPGMAFVTRVLETRRSGSAPSVVVDGSIAELPVIREFPRRVYASSEAGRSQELLRGEGRILGRLCMEDDILATDIQIPDWLQKDDLIVFSDCGAYDASMSYRFGKGGIE